MKTKNYNKVKLVIMLLVISMFLSANTFAKTNDDTNGEKAEKFLKNLIVGMESDNEGLKASCIYMLGAYRLEDASKKLLEEAKKSDSENDLKLIAWSLYEIGNEDHCAEFETVAKNYNSEKVDEILQYLKELKRLENSVVAN